MVSSAATAKGKHGVNIPIIGAEDVGYREFQDTLNGRIAERAYQISEENGRHAGHDEANWLQAESEVVTRVAEIQDSEGWVNVRMQLRDIPPSAISILVLSNEVIVCGVSSEPTDGPVTITSPREFVYLLAKWPSPVDPASASANLKDGIVTLTAKYSSPAGLEESTLDSEARVGGRPS